MFTEIGWTVMYYPMLTMLTWMRPAYFNIILHVSFFLFSFLFYFLFIFLCFKTYHTTCFTTP